MNDISWFVAVIAVQMLVFSKSGFAALTVLY